MDKTCIEIMNDTLSKFTSEEKRLIADTLAKHVRAASFPPIYRADLVLTEDCNCCCTYCFEGRRPSIAMKPEILEKAIDFVFDESRDSKHVAFVLFGGEPLLRFDLVKHAVEYGNRKALETDKRVAFEMTTNGTLLTEEIIEFGLRNSLSYLLSLDGDRETHDRHRRLRNGEGTYDKIMQWIPYLIKRQGWLGARVTPSPDTVHKFAANIRHLRSIGINQFIIGLASGQGWSVEMMKVYRQQWEELADFYIAERNRRAPIRISEFEDSWDTLVQKRRNAWGCSGGRNQIAISPTGDIYPCARFLALIDPYDGGRGSYRLGSLEEGMSNFKNREEVTNSYGSCRLNCLRCDFADACVGTCLAVDYEENGSIFNCRGYLCEEAKIILDLLKRRPELCTVGGGEWIEQGVADISHFQTIGVPFTG